MEIQGPGRVAKPDGSVRVYLLGDPMEWMQRKFFSTDSLKREEELMAEQVKAIPEGYHTVTPHLVLRDAAKAIEFYKKAFGAEEILRMPGPDGKSLMHAELKIGNSVVMLCDEFPQMERWLAPQSLKGTTVALHIYVQDVDKAFQRAVDAGAQVSMPVMDAFWGDRYGKLTDPFGHEWSMATHVKDLTPEEIQKGAEEFFSQLPKQE